jgi:hypothetical protein
MLQVEVEELLQQDRLLQVQVNQVMEEQVLLIQYQDHLYLILGVEVEEVILDMV